MLHAVVMAGGSGTRFWPESRRARPKQLLSLVGQRSLIADTLTRLEGLVAPEQTLVITSQSLVEAVRGELPQIAPQAVLGEPAKRDTAPCIGLAAVLIARRDPHATLLVMPSDHLIQPVDVFQRSLRQAADIVEQDARQLVTFGIRPTYPSTSFGYIERGAAWEPPVAVPGRAAAAAAHASAESTAAPVYRVARFREKPGVDTAWEYVASGKFYWNAGIFVWRAATILEALHLHQPHMYECLQRIAAAVDTADFPAVLQREFEAIHPISIDYAVMEHAPHVTVVEAPFEWDDVGSWQALARRGGGDPSGNTIFGKHLGWQSEGCVVRSQGDHLVVTVGLHDVVVVHTPDVTLVANKRDEEALRDVIRALEQRGWTEYL